MKMTIEDLQARLVSYMEAMGAGVKGVKGTLTYFGFVFLAKTKLQEIISTLDKDGFLSSLGIITDEGIDIDLLIQAADYLVPRLPEKIEVGCFVFGHPDIMGFFDALKEKK
ncbi:MAG: hypothetical protein J1G30_04305 [Spirochaetales bacterium]|nr:hypothetical protein [Spirochaetales bacterium]